MESGNKNFSPDLRQALLRYNARFPLPADFIADTMLEVNRVADRRAYIRGLVTISVVSLLMIVLAVVMFRFFGITLTMSVPVPVAGMTTVFASVDHTISVVESIISSPLIVMLAVSAAILLSLDRLMRRHFAARHVS